MSNLPSRLSEDQCRALKKELKMLKITVTHRGKQCPKMTVSDISNRGAGQIFFDMEGKEVSVAKYFEQKYHRLRYPDWPCVVVGNKKNMVPLEVIKVIAAQPYKRKLNETQTAGMVRQTTVKPFVRLRQIENMRSTIKTNDPYLKAFGIQIGERPLEVEAKVLDPPEIQYGDRTMIRPQTGVWNLRNRERFHNPGTVGTWAVVNLASLNDNDVERGCRGLVNMLRQCGMNVEDRPAVVRHLNSDSSVGYDIKGVYEEAQKKSGSNHVDFILVILASKDSLTYAKVKHASDVIVGTPTQCIQANNFRMGKPQLLCNVAMKINTKVGGNNSHPVNRAPDAVNGSLPYMDVPCMLLGADVTHPSPSDRTAPSIAAVVASMDRFATKFVTAVSVLPHRSETILNLKDIVKAQLKTFYQRTNGKKPERIIMYRDGVGEGQFMEVRNNEVQAIHDACQEIEPDYAPGITFIIVQKRHHTRFFPGNGRDDKDRSGNCLPGTVVDSVIGHPQDFDFFLLSHSGIQGTSRPTHYQVVYDDNNMTPLKLQTLTYLLAYSYCRCTRSISMASPAYYAHLACFRARVHLQAAAFQHDTMSSIGRSSDNSEVERERGRMRNVAIEATQIHEDLLNSKFGMYWS